MLSTRRLSLGKTLTVAAIVPFFTRPVFIERLRGIEATLSESAYDLVIYNVETPQKRDDYIRNVPRRERTDGVLIISLPPRDSDVAGLAQTAVPVVLVDAYHPALTGLDTVTTDDVAGGRAATQHLLDLGHRRIGFVGDSLETNFNFTSSRDRFQGYQQALAGAGVPFRREYHAQGEHGRYEARQGAATLLALPERPTAIFAASDTQALGVQQAARDAGLSIPADLSVIGYDDVEIAEYLGLTTMRQYLFESGKRGVELLLDRLADPTAAPVREILSAELVVRQTTALVA